MQPLEQSALVESGNRTENGQFPKGVSGNPAGRPKKQRLIDLQRDLEIAVRESLSVERVQRIVEKIAVMAEGGDLRAAKLILDKTISNAQPGEDVDNAGGRTVVFRIENATFTKEPEKQAIEVKVIDVTEAKHE